MRRGDGRDASASSPSFYSSSADGSCSSLSLATAYNKVAYNDSELRSTPRHKPIYRTNAVRKWAFHHNSLKTGRSKDLPPEKLHFNHFWGARTFGWGDVIPDQLLAKTDEYRVAAELADAVRAWTAVRRRRLGSEAVEPPPPASFLSS